MRIFTGLAAGLALAAGTPTLALTITATPNVEQAQRLQAQRGGGPQLSDTFVGAGRPMDGAGFSSGRQPAYGRTTTYSFGDVTTTIRTDDGAFYPTPTDSERGSGSPYLLTPNLPHRRR
jgi:hypothetical protein